GGELGADRTGADDDERLRHFLQLKYVVGVYDALAVGLETGDGTDDRAGGDEYVSRADGLLPAALVTDLDLAGKLQPREAVEGRHLVLLHKVLDALRVLQHDLVLALLHVCEGESHALDLHAEVCQVLPRLLVVVRRHQKLLRRDAPAQAACAAEPLVLLDDGDLESELRRAYRRDVAARPRPYDRQVKLFRRQCS